MMCEVAFSESVSLIRITGQEMEKCDYSDWTLDLVKVIISHLVCSRSLRVLSFISCRIARL
jgi:hypothetical protein